MCGPQVESDNGIVGAAYRGLGGPAKYNPQTPAPAPSVPAPKPVTPTSPIAPAAAASTTTAVDPTQSPGQQLGNMFGQPQQQATFNVGSKANNAASKVIY